MEAKHFQDQQIAEKQEKKRLETLIKKNEQEKMLAEVEQHNIKEKQKKEERIMKLRTHQEEVIKQKQI